MIFIGKMLFNESNSCNLTLHCFPVYSKTTGPGVRLLLSPSPIVTWTGSCGTRELSAETSDISGTI